MLILEAVAGFQIFIPTSIVASWEGQVGQSICGEIASVDGPFVAVAGCGGLDRILSGYG